MTVEEFDQQQAALPCKHCSAFALEKFPRKPHIGARCKECGTWQYWLKQTSQSQLSPDQQLAAAFQPDPDWGTPPTKQPSPRYLPNQIAHPVTLEERVAALEHDLTILTQLFIGKKSH